MSDLVPALLPLDKGLNLQDAKIVAPIGSVLDTINYEQVDFKGQKRIDGYARYDGSFLPALNDYYTVVLTTYGGAPVLNDLVLTVDNTLFGIVISVSAVVAGLVTVNIAIINENVTPAVSAVLTFWRYTSYPSTSTYVVNSAQKCSDSSITASAQYTNLLSFTNYLRSRVGKLPGETIGLHWFRDRLYAVADVACINLGFPSTTIYPNDQLALDTGEVAKVLDLRVATDNSSMVYLDTTNANAWYPIGINVKKNGVSVGVTTAIPPIDMGLQIASFFESRDEQQVYNEDPTNGPFKFGWKFVDQGWIVKFLNGITLYGSLPSINQNIEGLGQQGPTLIISGYGKPLLLSQKNAITGKPTQINGWKDSETPTSYQLNSANVAEDDSLYVYADAFISWNGTTGAVVAPGYTDDNLTEYSATNTVNISL